MERFEFKESVSIIKSTGQKARDLKELRAGIETISDASLFHHTYQYFLKGHILEYTNDFAHWAGETIEERILAEQLTSIDPYRFETIDKLRRELISVIDRFLAHFPYPREALPGSEFFFNESMIIVFPARQWAGNLAEFLIAIRFVDPASIYYHFYEARVRLGVDDFSEWIEKALKKEALAERIRGIDPFIHNLEKVRDLIARFVEGEVRMDMERGVV